jgi:predicted MFS family arabinose efflux permease
MEPVKQTVIPFTGYQKLVITLLAIMQFTVVLDFMVLNPLGDILMKSLDLTPVRFGLVVSSYAISAGVSGIFAAGFADKFDRKKLLLFFYAGFILGTFCCAMADSFAVLLAARIVTGLFGGVIGSISMAIITDLFAIDQRGRVMGFVQMSFAASQILGIPIGLFFADIWGWHSSFLMIVVLALVTALVIFFRLKPVNAHLKLQLDKSPLLHLWHTLTNKHYQIGFVATAFLSVGGFMLMPFGSAFLINNIGIHQEQLKLLFMLTGFSSVIVMPIVGKLSDKYDKFLLFTCGSVLSIIMITIYTNLSITPLWEIIAINMVLFMGIMSRMVPVMALSSAVPEARDRGAYMSVNSSLQQMAGGLAALCAGLIVVQKTKTSPLEHYGTLGFVVSGVVVVCLFLVYRVSVLVKTKTAERELASINQAIAAKNQPVSSVQLDEAVPS